MKREKGANRVASNKERKREINGNESAEEGNLGN